MQSLREVFTAPFNWCDRRCERCPLAGECPVYRREQQRRWVHEARGRDPDDPAVVAEDMHEAVELTLRMVTEVAAEEGIDLNEPAPPRPIALDARRLERASMTLAYCVGDAPPPADAEARATLAELRLLASTLARKAARIASYIEESVEDESLWARDAAPNLLLLDRVKAQIARAFPRIAGGELAERASRVLAELDRMLDPLIREIGEPARSVLAALEARGAAPSPFLGGQENA